MNIRWILLLSLLALALGGCGGSSQAGSEQHPELPLASPTKEPLSTLIPVQPTKGDNTQMTQSLPTPLASGLEGLVEKAKEDLAQRLSISVSQINLVEATPVTWPDGSLGCPQPDMVYTQVQVDGLLIRLGVDDRVYEYHSGGNRAPFLCG
jgi:hypothetical protein